jgi:hypothetical protein
MIAHSALERSTGAAGTESDDPQPNQLDLLFSLLGLWAAGPAFEAEAASIASSFQIVSYEDISTQELDERVWTDSSEERAERWPVDGLVTERGWPVPTRADDTPRVE